MGDSGRRITKKAHSNMCGDSQSSLHSSGHLLVSLLSPATSRFTVLSLPEGTSESCDFSVFLPFFRERLSPTSAQPIFRFPAQHSATYVCRQGN